MSEAALPTAPGSVTGMIGLEKHLLDRVEAAVMAVDLTGRILFANRFVEQLYGWAPEELIGRSSAELAGVSVGPELASEIFQALEARSSWEGVFEVRRRDGSLISVHAIDSPLYDTAGQLVGVVSVGIDGSRERAVETLLQEQATIAGVFRQLGETLLETHDLGQLLQAVTDIATQAAGAEIGAFFYNVDDGGKPRSLYALSGAIGSASVIPTPTFVLDDVIRVDDLTAESHAGEEPVHPGLPDVDPPIRSYLAAPVRSRAGDVLGGLCFGHHQPGRFSAGDADVVGAIAAQAGVAIDNTEAHKSLETEIAQRTHAQSVEHFLKRCAMVLSSSLDYEHNFEALADLAVPFLADMCMIDVEDDREIRRVAVAHADPTKHELIDELKERYAPDPWGRHPAVRALREGQASFGGEMTEEFLRATTRDERHYEIVTELGLSSFISVPLCARGRIQGALTLVSCSPDRAFDDRDVEIATELAGHAAVALDNARLYDDQQRARAEAEAVAERLRQLQRLAAELSKAVSVTEVAHVIRGVSMLALETPSRGLWLVDESTHVLRLASGSDPGTVDPRFETIALDEPLPAAEVLNTGVPVFVRSLEDRDRLYPALAHTRPNGKSFAVLPLYAQEHVIGILALGFKDERPFDDDEIRFITAVAEQCGQALSRALLYDRERLGRDQAEADRRRIHELNRALQTSLLPPSLPEIPGLEVSARYHPALAGLEVGGDFYDVFDTGGDWAVIVGDVCGKGPVAAAVTATARWTIRSVAMDMRQPAQVLRKLNEAMVHQQLDDRFCTVTYTRVVPTAQGVRLSVCRGGHPAPLVLRASGEVEAIGTPGTLIGVLPDVRLWEETTQLQPGDAFVAYTDGVTEARRDREQFGDDRLRETLGGCVGLDADAIGATIEAAVLGFGGPEPSDDLAILVLRVPP